MPPTPAITDRFGSTSDLGMQAPPTGGYSIALFEQHLVSLEQRFRVMRAENDPRAVFQITYLTFSRQVLAALQAERFKDLVWATDMCCRFIEVYLHQLVLWDRRDPGQCRAWRVAFQSMESGTANLVQAMLLGMNAHINYDLAFVTLGACVHAGDLPATTDVSGRALTANRSGIPSVRYSDFLVINQLAWESVPIIQDAVLSEFNKLFYWGNKLTGRFTMALGERVMLDSRDESWFQTCLLVHARNGEERARVTRMIDVYAAGMADIVASLTPRPWRVWDALGAWERRGERLDPEIQSGMLELAITSPVVAELVLRQLAFLGADPVAALVTLLRADERLLAGSFGHLVVRLAPRRQRRALMQWLAAATAPALAALEAMMDSGDLGPSLRRRLPVERVQERWRQQRQDSRSCLDVPEVKVDPDLRCALEGDIHDLDKRLAAVGDGVGVDMRAPGSSRLTSLRAVDAQALLARHPSRWVRLCATRALGIASTPTSEGEAREEGDTVSSSIERVLFLKETPVFMEVDPAVLVHVAEQLVPESFKAGEYLTRSGVHVGGIRLVRNGEVAVSQERDGQRVNIRTMGPHDSLGELSALNDTPATADCIAVGAVESFFLPGRVLSHLMHQHPRLAIGLIRVLSERLISLTLLVVHQKSSVV